MLFLLALLFFSLGTSVAALPMDLHREHNPDSGAVDLYVKLDELPIRHRGCWTPTVSERCSFNVTSFDLE